MSHLPTYLQRRSQRVSNVLVTGEGTSLSGRVLQAKWRESQVRVTDRLPPSLALPCCAPARPDRCWRTPSRLPLRLWAAAEARLRGPPAA